MPIFPKNVLLRYPDVVEVDHASARGPDAKLVLRLGDGEPRGFAFHDEASDAFVALEIASGLGELQVKRA